MFPRLNIYHHPFDNLQLIAFLVVTVSWWDLGERFFSTIRTNRSSVLVFIELKPPPFSNAGQF